MDCNVFRFLKTFLRVDFQKYTFRVKGFKLLYILVVIEECCLFVF